MDRQTLVVATDFSAPAQRATELAVALSLRLGWPLRIVHAWSTGGWYPPDVSSGEFPLEPLLDSTRASVEELLDRVVSECRQGGADVEGRFEVGAASRMIPALAERERAGLVVVGRRGSARLNHVLLGSVSERVVRGTACPVLVVPGGPEPATLPRKLLVGIDFSNASREALVIAESLRHSLGEAEPLVLAHAYQDERADWLASWSETGRRLNQEQSEASLGRWARKAVQNPSSFTLRVLPGVAESVLLEAAKSEDCDWIVLGQQGRTALALFLLGGTTRHILEIADRPVLVIPPTGAPEREAID